MEREHVPRRVERAEIRSITSTNISFLSERPASGIAKLRSACPVDDSAASVERDHGRLVVQGEVELIRGCRNRVEEDERDLDRPVDEKVVDHTRQKLNRAETTASIEHRTTILRFCPQLRHHRGIARARSMTSARRQLCRRRQKNKASVLRTRAA